MALRSAVLNIGNKFEAGQLIVSDIERLYDTFSDLLT